MSSTLTPLLNNNWKRNPGHVWLEATRPTSSSNSTPIAAPSTTLELYRLPAVSSEEVEFWEQTIATFTVSDAGGVEVGDSLSLPDAIDNSEEYLTVTAIAADRSSITAQYAGYRLLVTVGIRLVPVGNRPQMYLGGLGVTPVTGTSTDAMGRAEFYAAPGTFSILARYPSSTGLAPVLFDYMPGVDAQVDEPYLNAGNYASLQAALAALPASGGRVFIPAGVYTVPSGGLRLAKSVELFGEHPAKTVLRPAVKNADNQPVILIDASERTIDWIRLRDLRLENGSPPSGRFEHSHGISCVTTTNRKVERFSADRIDAVDLASDGFHFEGANLDHGAIVFLSLHECASTRCMGSGFYIEYATVVGAQSCYANGNSLFGAYCQHSQVAWYSCAFENNCQRVVESGQPVLAKSSDSGTDYDATWGAQLRMRLCVPARVDACDFEGFSEYAENNRGAKTAIIVENCNGALISNSSFVTRAVGADPNRTVDTGTKGIWVSGESAAGWMTIMPNLFQNVARAVEVSADCVAVSVMNQRVSVESGVSGSVAVQSAGIAVPALPASQILPAPAGNAVGQLVFDSTLNVLKCWTGNAWRSLGWAP